jgi:hypothetical protein
MHFILQWELVLLLRMDICDMWRVICVMCDVMCVMCFVLCFVLCYRKERKERKKERRNSHIKHHRVMPSSVLDLQKLADQINRREYTVIAVAEGYGRHSPHTAEDRYFSLS